MSAAFTGAEAARAIDDCWNRIGVRGDKSCAELPRHIHCRNCPVYSHAARSLLDANSPPDYVEFWTEQLARPVEQTQSDAQSLIVFRLGDECLALPTKVCVEVAELRPIHSLPHRRNQSVLGLVNVRGELLPCVSMAAILGVKQ